MKRNKKASDKKTSKASKYYFGGLKIYSLDEIENEVLNESIYLDVFAGSDLRLKENVKTVSRSLDALKKLDVIEYAWKKNSKKTRTEIGVVAQQVAEIFPHLVRQDEASGYLAVNYTKLTPHLINAVKELSATVEAQTQRIAVLERKLKN